jgi:hypothetical protein
MEHPVGDFHPELICRNEKSPAFLRSPGFRYAT